jgi:hypothetical protein
MIQSLTPVQLNLLRRCTERLRVWEIGAALTALLAELSTLQQLDLVAFDEAHGWQLTPAGAACLHKLDVAALPRTRPRP